jgi:hypothetical protein
MKFEAINLPKSERFACSARELKAAFSDVENLGVFCGALSKSFSFDSRSKSRPKLEGTVVASAQVSRDLEAILNLYAVRRDVYPERAAHEFCESVIPQIHEWLRSQLAKRRTAVLGVESLLVEWTGREHKKHGMRFL